MCLVINSSYRMLGFIIRNSKFFSSIDSVVMLYNSFVRSRLEYCSIVWDPFSTGKILAIEQVQNKFLRYLYYKQFNAPCDRDLSTVVLRRIFSFDTLLSRRNKLSLMFVYKIIHSLIDSFFFLNKIQLFVPRNNLRPSIVFFVPKCNTVQYYNFSFFKALRFLNLFKNEVDVFNNKVSLFSAQINSVLLI